MRAITRTFTKAQLVDEMDLPASVGSGEGCTVISDKIIDQGRWRTRHRLIFRLDGQAEGEAWSVYYSHGSTEMQDGRPWEDEPVITATLMRQVEKVVKIWEVADGTP